MRKTIGALATLSLLTACSGITVPPDPAAQEGVIVERDRPTSFEKDRPTIWVKDTSDDPEECGVIYVIASGSDLFTRDDRGAVEKIGVDALKVGAAVRVWTELVLTSCPGQSTAEAVELITSA